MKKVNVEKTKKSFSDYLEKSFNNQEIVFYNKLVSIARNIDSFKSEGELRKALKDISNQLKKINP